MISSGQTTRSRARRPQVSTDRASIAAGASGTDLRLLWGDATRNRASLSLLVSRELDSLQRGSLASAVDGGCCTKLSAKTWAALAVTVTDGAHSAEAGQGAPRTSDDLRLF